MPPAFRLSRLLVVWITVSIAVAIAGPFGTINLPLPTRLPYWLGLIGANTLVWTLWFRLGARWLGWNDRVRTFLALSGVVTVNLPLPPLVNFANHTAGATFTAPYWPVYSSSVAMGAAMMAGIFGLRWMRRNEQPVPHANAILHPMAEPVIVTEPAPTALPDVTANPAMPEAASGGLFARAGVADPTQVLAVEAEDHYLRLYLADGRKPLVLYRLRDALAELTALDGEQVHRGYWVASGAVRGLERRDGRKWALRLHSGLLIPVSATFLPMVRKRGWRELDPALEP